jgi:hypothetical protein
MNRMEIRLRECKNDGRDRTNGTKTGQDGGFTRPWACIKSSHAEMYVELHGQPRSGTEKVYSSILVSK